MCRSRRELSNAYLLAKFGFDTAENEPLQVHLILKLWGLIFTEPPRLGPAAGAGEKRGREKEEQHFSHFEVGKFVEWARGRRNAGGASREGIPHAGPIAE